MSKLEINNIPIGDVSKRDISPIKPININETLLCGMKCQLDINGLLIGSSYTGNSKCSLTVVDFNTSKTRQGVGTNKQIVPCIFINFDSEGAPDLSVEFKNYKYNLKCILLTNGHIHSFKNKSSIDDQNEVILIFSNETDNVDPILCLSIITDINETYSTGSEFFSQIFDILNKPNEFTGKYITQNNKKRNSFNVKVDPNWNPTMLIPNNKSFVYYQGTFPFKIGVDVVDKNIKTCTWIIFENNITILKETNETIKNMLYQKRAGTGLEPISYITDKVHQKPSNYSLYRYSDSKYREKLKASDVVIKCKKNADQCDDGQVINEKTGEIITSEYQRHINEKTGEIITSEYQRQELNDHVNNCPATLTQSQISSIIDSTFSENIPNLGDILLIMTHILLSIGIVIASYIIVKRYFINDYSNSIFIHFPVVFMGWFTDTAAGRKIKKATQGSSSSGGDLVDNHTRFTEQYNDNYSNLRH